MGNRRWSDEEVEYLLNSRGYRSIPCIANKLNRSINSVLRKSVRIGAGGYKDNTDMINASDVADILGVSERTVYNLVYDNKIKCFKRRITGKAYHYFFDYDYVMKYADTYKSERGRKWNELETSRLMTYKLAGLTNKEIADRLNRSEAAITIKISKIKKRSEENGRHKNDMG